MGSSQQANVFCTRSGSVVSDSTKQNCKIPRNANFAHRPMLPRVCVTVSSLLFSAVVSRHVNRVSMFPATLARAFSSVPRAVTSLPSATRPSLPRYVSPAHRRRVVAAAALHQLAGWRSTVRSRVDCHMCGAGYQQVIGRCAIAGVRGQVDATALSTWTCDDSVEGPSAVTGRPRTSWEPGYRLCLASPHA